MIRVDNLCLRHGEKQILANVSFEVAMGETLAIVGESGGGKTSIARLLLGLLKGSVDRGQTHHDSFMWSGQALVGDVDMLRATRSSIERIRGREITMIVQALSDALNPHLTVRQHVREVLVLGQRTDTDIEQACGEWNIPEQIRDRYPSGLSGGEIQRVLTALALLPRPRCLVLDEPTASLDQENRARAVEAFAIGRVSRCQLLITHDLKLARQMADRVAVLRNGRIVETGPTSDVLKKPSTSYAASLIAATGGLSQAASPKRQASPPQGGLRVRNLSHSYAGVQVLNGLSFDVPKGQCLAVLGESGSGKSTLARILAGYEPHGSGQIEWIGVDGSRDDVPRCALVSQHPHGAVPRHFTVADVLEEALMLAGRRKFGAMEELLELVGLPADSGFLTRQTAALSGGEAQRLVIARALAGEPDCIVADEPTAALDTISRLTVLRLFQRLQAERQLTLVLITHEPDVARHLTRNIIRLPTHSEAHCDAGWLEGVRSRNKR